MDIHRCRFIPYNPSAINALAFSHPPAIDRPGRGVSTLRLAIGRANGDIEIYNPQRGIWLQETVIRGGPDRSIEGLVWTLDPSEDGEDGKRVPGQLRLFSIGASNVVTEWDLAKGKPARHSAGNFGEVWCLAAQPRLTANKQRGNSSAKASQGEFEGQHLAVGCADGSIVILSTEDNDLQYIRTMRPSTRKARVLSIAFKDRHTAVAGYSDSAIRVFDIRNGRLLRTITLGNAAPRKELLVWSVKCLPDGDIVSGDSSGEVRFWDARNYSLIQRIQGHHADVLDLAVSGDGQTVVSGGADQRTTLYRLNNSNRKRWIELMHRRYHTHDVKAFALYETKDISVLVSGGLDTVPIVLPLRQYGTEHHRKLSSLPQAPPLASSPSLRMLMCWWDREINIWRLGRPSEDGPSHRLVGKVLLRGEENLSAATLSSDGQFVVASTASETKMFALKRDTVDDGRPILRVQKVDLPTTIAERGARLVAISPDSNWLALVQPNSEVLVARIETVPSKTGRTVTVSPKLCRLPRVSRFTRHDKESQGTHGDYNRTITSMNFSHNSRVLACGDLSGSIDTWILRDAPAESTEKKPRHQEDSDDSSDESDSEDEDVVFGTEQWILPSTESPIPRLSSSILVLTFRPPYFMPKTKQSSASPSPDDNLVAVTADHQIAEFEVLTGKPTQWSRRNPKSSMPADFTNVKGRTMGAFWENHLPPSNGTSDSTEKKEHQSETSKQRLWLFGPNWIWMFDLSQDFPKSATKEQVTESQEETKRDRQQHGHKRKRSAHDKHQPNGQNDEPPHNSGAGDQMPLSKSYIGLARKMRRNTGPAATDDDASNANTDKNNANENKGSRAVDVELRNDFHTINDPDAREDESSDSESDNESESEEEEEHNKDDVNGSAQAEIADTNGGIEKRSSRSRPWWNTFKYRELLGIAAIGSGRDTRWEDVEADNEADARPNGGQADGGSLEIAVIERPMWDVDLPERYIRDYE